MLLTYLALQRFVISPGALWLMELNVDPVTLKEFEEVVHKEYADNQARDSLSQAMMCDNFDEEEEELWWCMQRGQANQTQMARVKASIAAALKEQKNRYTRREEQRKIRFEELLSQSIAQTKAKKAAQQENWKKQMAA
ncbi:hypothetical protein SERLA73DRAFT_156754 [Serpula lacrymans var. lacrymans S7.3]|uniref:Uncharacterized protein n=1 Tax=Serpula lacrymans var. lacrymans (strain S7.3) TaxID=936435 RepID=F8QFW2_SERL3|nr:hypothetical protein SERLA73DRAFT_156754 [Serpula lacrymans var. lacrymans S7.3]